ncbi:hypothetical protein K431DRAFT_338297 [Polychaeton citri CBS 116435]|uniref:Uncharacterized protein n=1 Tax=Polychaeton citri CBS 116435 TaxID=1314669 RepID=A0A9P4UPY5_9PEZI|nr:hypothetical protein K431DRAFT_338297 [Polychaeton citri CBS 116435]
MSSEALAVARKNLGHELGDLAEQHLKHDLQQSDRDALVSAASKVSTHASVGSLLGVTFGIYLAYRLRSNRAAVFNAFKANAGQKPVSVSLADGTSHTLPDLTPVMRPSLAGDILTYTFLGAGGLFFGGELGLLSGTISARRGILKDRESFERIEGAFKSFQADALRKKADLLEKGGSGILTAKY